MRPARWTGSPRVTEISLDRMPQNQCSIGGVPVLPFGIRVGLVSSCRHGRP